MSIWKVTVDCHYVPAKKESGRQQRVFMIEAEDRHIAQKAAIELADSTANCAHEWTSFEFRELSNVAFPYEVKP